MHSKVQMREKHSTYRISSCKYLRACSCRVIGPLFLSGAAIVTVFPMVEWKITARSYDDSKYKLKNDKTNLNVLVCNSRIMIDGYVWEI